MTKDVYVLFSIKHKRFNPSLVGIFTDKKIASEAEKKFHFSHPNHTTSFILQIPICETVIDYENYWKSVLSTEIIKKVRKY